MVPWSCSHGPIVERSGPLLVPISNLLPDVTQVARIQFAEIAESMLASKTGAHKHLLDGWTFGCPSPLTAPSHDSGYKPLKV